MKNLKADLWAWIIFLLAWGYILLNFSTLPDRVPVHYDFRGLPDRYGHPAEVFVMLALVLPYFFLGLLGPEKAGIKGEQNGRTFGQLMQYARLLLLLLPSGIALGEVLTWQGHLGTSGMLKMVFSMVGVFLMLIGNISPRVSRNLMSGIRTSYTLRSDLAWSDVNRKGAYLMTLCGLLVLVLAWILPDMWAILGLMLSMLVLLVGLFSLNSRARMLWEKDPRRIPLEQKPF